MADRDLEKARRAPLLGLRGAGLKPNLYDLAIFILIAAAFVLAAHGVHQIAAPASITPRFTASMIWGTLPWQGL